MIRTLPTQLFTTVLLLLFCSQTFSQREEFLSTLTATKEMGTNKTQLNWVDEDGASFNVFRKELGGTGYFSIASELTGVDSFVDENSDINTAYEYIVQKVNAAGSYPAVIYAGNEMEAVGDRGRLLLLIDDTHFDFLKDKIDRWIADAEGDGWRVIYKTVSPSQAVTEVKALIVEEYNSAESLHAVFLLGHIPVPYSGNIVPDGHTNNHYGAWPADVYYAEMNENWTDAIVTTSGQPARTTNIPGEAVQQYVQAGTCTNK